MKTFLLLLCGAAAVFANPLGEVAETPDMEEPRISCPGGWIAFKDSCYNFGAPGKTWNAAATRCLQMGGRLASIESQDEQNFVVTEHNKVCGRGDAWIGAVLYDTWRWHHNLAPLTYSAWGQNEPSYDNNNEKCVMLYYKLGYSWNDDYCEGGHCSVCEMP